ncbi:MAG: iron ABC transporter permease [Hyphomonadaceae bacterium]|nr:iron ABC transporter permease [Hyphomonadaceae bacterium]
MRALPLYALLLGAGFFLVAPVASVVATSFNVAELGRSYSFGFGHWREVFAEPAMRDALLNTATLSIARQAIGLSLGAMIAWLIARTDLPWRRTLEVGFWIALFMPPLPAALAWVLLLQGSSGLVNRALFELPFVDAPVFGLYSWWGIVWVHIMGATLALKVFLLVPAFRALDSSLEDAARASGAGLARTFTKIVLPMMAPAILAIGLIGLVRSMQAFEVELILGAPAGIDVYSTFIYRAMTREPPEPGLSSALSVLFILTLAPLVLIQQWYGRRRAHASLTGRARSRRQPLGRAKWPAFALVAALLFLMTLAPLGMLLMGTFMHMFGIFDMPNPWTLDNWREALTRGDALRALGNTLQLGIAAALCGMILFTLMAYVVVRSRSRAARLLDLLTWAPVLVPGVVLSLGLLQVFTGSSAFRALYGTIASMTIAVLVSTATVGVQFLKTTMRQIGPELEEAGLASGGSRLYVLRRIVLPLIAPSIAVIGLETFAAANVAVSAVAFLGVGPTQPLSMLQLNLLNSGQLETAAVVGVVIMSLTIVSALLARWLADRQGLETEA